jgi:ribosomal protein S12 methylthiotransferase
VVAGCLPQRYGEELAEALPEVDLFIGTGEVFKLQEILESRNAGRRVFVGLPKALYDEAAPRLLTTGSYSSYLKISEGCNHRCAFCIIPTLRGKTRSRSILSLAAEVSRLTSLGVKEINLIAEDLTSYGQDLKDGSSLSSLLREISHLDGVEWIRLLYAYPSLINRTLLRTICEEQKVCRYLDMPLQHASDSMLRGMKRGGSREALRRLICRIRAEVPGIALRTTFIVGFPGETERDFQLLKDFVSEMEFDHVGVFQYSREEGTEAASMKRQIPEGTRERRWHELMQIQRVISRKKNQGLIGQIRRAIICKAPSKGHGSLTGRIEHQAPDVDGVTWIQGDRLQPGTMCRVKITGATDYDLSGEILKGV